MIKRNQHFFNFLLVLIDALTIILSMFFAWYVRFDTPFFRDGIRALRFEEYMQVLFFVIPVYIILFVIFGLYKPFRKQRFYRECEKIFGACTIGIFIIVAILFIIKSIHYSRLMLGSFYVISLLMLILERGAIRKILGIMRAKGYNIKYMIIVGAGVNGREFARKMTDERQLGYRVCGFVDDHIDAAEIDQIPILGKISDLKNILEKYRVDEVIVALPNGMDKLINTVINECEYQGIKTMVIPDYYQLVKGAQPSFDEVDGIPLINTRYIPLDDPLKGFIKRFFDILLSAVAIIILSPIMLITAIMVKVTSPGPIIYKQIRVGLNRKEFNIYKFRSMRNDIPEVSNQGWTTENDPRKTKVGSFIRKTSIDELPQLFNILKGDMSIVGPRPERPFYVNKFKDEIPHYMIKHHVRPGLTGWAQVNGWRGDTDIAPRILCDIEYIEKWSIWFDIKIIFMTPFSMFKTGY